MNDKEFIQSFNDMAKHAETTARSKGFLTRENPSDGLLIALMHSELSEALEAIRKGLTSDHIPEYKGIEEELADLIIRIADYASAKRYRVAEAVVAKLAFNATRSHMHGGKKF